MRRELRPTLPTNRFGVRAEPVDFLESLPDVRILKTWSVRRGLQQVQCGRDVSRGRPVVNETGAPCPERSISAAKSAHLRVAVAEIAAGDRCRALSRSQTLCVAWLRGRDDGRPLRAHGAVATRARDHDCRRDPRRDDRHGHAATRRSAVACSPKKPMATSSRRCGRAAAVSASSHASRSRRVSIRNRCSPRCSAWRTQRAGPIHDVTDVFIEVNPRHVAFYSRILGFVVAAGEKLCERVRAPSVLLHAEVEALAARLRVLADIAMPHSLLGEAA